MNQLAILLRPTELKDVVGQTHLVGLQKPITVMAESGQLPSIIFWGPPGVGKTTIARILAKKQKRDFVELSAVSASKKDIANIVKSTQEQKELVQSYQAPVLFLDEIHRFNKAQQDFLLPFVEQGIIILIGATTENPSFEVISALLSRTKVFVLQPLEEADLKKLVKLAIKHLNRQDQQKISLPKAAQDWLVSYANGDARRLLNLIDTTYSLYKEISLETLKQTVTKTALRYDKSADEHYDTISSYLKSMRASNTDAALYYLARMVEAGEDPKFIARRMVIFASEDIGLAQPTALVVANAVFDAVSKIGYPETQINLAHGTAYLSRAKKDRSAYDAFFAALDDVKKHGNLPIPLHLRNAPTKLMKELGYGKGYEMYPDPKESLLPEKLKGRKYLKTKKDN